ncbi:MAG: ArsR family transcriptional regulator, partial [Saprospiraceae bacterium]|nr:ArsR family transcriptional regulator [Saprospiraceae bacterium]
SSKTRIKLLLKFFLNSSNTAYLRGLESEFGESTNAIRVELNRFEDAGMLTSFSRGNKKIFQANTTHPLFNEVHNIVMKYVGVDRIIENVIERLGDVQSVYLAGEFARGVNSDIIDLIFVGDINKEYLLNLIDKVEPMVSRRIRYLIYADRANFEKTWDGKPQKPFLIWSKDQNQAEK